MNRLRSHRLPIAWVLFAFILLNGLACSLGHGLMMGGGGMQKRSLVADAQTQTHTHAHTQGDMKLAAAMPMASDPKPPGGHDLQKSLMGDCPFATVLTFAIACLAALGWLLRRVRGAVAFSSPWEGLPFRLAFPALNPHGP